MRSPLFAELTHLFHELGVFLEMDFVRGIVVQAHHQLLGKEMHVREFDELLENVFGSGEISAFLQCLRKRIQ